MIFYGRFSYAPENRDKVQRRFLETGAPPPAGVTMLGRWHDAGGNDGVFVAESEDLSAVAAWLQEWTDMVRFDLRPALTDAEFAAVVGA